MKSLQGRFEDFLPGNLDVREGKVFVWFVYCAGMFSGLEKVRYNQWRDRGKLRRILTV